MLTPAQFADMLRRLDPASLEAALVSAGESRWHREVDTEIELIIDSFLCEVGLRLRSARLFEKAELAGNAVAAEDLRAGMAVMDVAPKGTVQHKRAAAKVAGAKRLVRRAVKPRRK